MAYKVQPLSLSQMLFNLYSLKSRQFKEGYAIKGKNFYHMAYSIGLK